MFKINDVKKFREAFRGSHYGQLWNDPAMKDFRDDLIQKLEDATKPSRRSSASALGELLELPQGPVAIAVVSRDDPKLPVAVAILADAGANKDKMADVLTKATKQAEEAGAKASQETFNGLTLHILQRAPERSPRRRTRRRGQVHADFSVAWTQSEGTFYFSVGTPGSDVDVIKDLTAHREGRDNSPGQQRVLRQDPGQDRLRQVPGRLVPRHRQAGQAGAQGQRHGATRARPSRTRSWSRQLGVNGLKSVGGCFTLGTGNYDSLSKTFFLAPKPVHGLAQDLLVPAGRLRPESWVPATVASYQSFSWDLDNAYDAINEIVNKFQPGMLNLVEQQLVGPNGGQPLSFQKDFFGPLGDRITLISDFKKPIKEDSQRMLLGVALEDAKAFQNTLNRIFEIAQGDAAEAGVPGHDDLRRRHAQHAQSQRRQGAQRSRVRSASRSPRIRSSSPRDTTLLEQILRPGNAPLDENAGFQSVVKEIPERVSGMSFVRPDESARLIYDLVKSGQIEKAIQQAMGGHAAAPAAATAPRSARSSPTRSSPTSPSFAKYLSLRGSYSVMDDDGFIMTGFTLKRSGP